MSSVWPLQFLLGASLSLLALVHRGGKRVAFQVFLYTVVYALSKINCDEVSCSTSQE